MQKAKDKAERQKKLNLTYLSKEYKGPFYEILKFLNERELCRI